MKKMKLLIIVLICGFSNCSEINYLDSQEYEDKRERVEILGKEINSKSEFSDAEFELFNVNGFSTSWLTLPGTSSLDYKFCIKVHSNEIDNWIDRMIKIDTIVQEIGWINKLIDKRKDNWLLTSEPEYYIREETDVQLIIYRTEGIIFKQVVNN